MTAPASTEAVWRRAWWGRAVIYEVYLRSFADGSGDGVGDLAGLLAHLPHLQRLGVDALWITPWYPSPMHDGGYDVADYCDIDPLFGTLDDARELIERSHEAGLRVVIDVVANHTSIEHPWFRAARAAGPGAAERERYIVRDGRGPRGEQPPNDWVSAFGGPAWTRLAGPDGEPEQWYLHLFAPEQPDLDWSHVGVQRDIDAVLRFWLGLGVDGLRVDAAPALAKAPGLPDFGLAADALFDPCAWVDSPMWDVDAVHAIYRRWRALADTYPGDRLLVGEVPVNGPQRLARYLRPDELHTAFNLDFLKTAWEPKALRGVIDVSLDAHHRVGAAPTWVLSSHDEPRHVTRYGRSRPGAPVDLALGTRRARAALLLMLALPGGAYLYQGEELGLWQVEDLPADRLQDPIVRRSGGRLPARDGCRVPLPWSGDAPPFGFTDPTVEPWLPQPASWSQLTAAVQEDDPGSVLSLYQAALALRRRLLTRIMLSAQDDLVWVPAPDGVLVFDHGPGWRCVLNLADEPYPVDGEVLLASDALPGPPPGQAVPRDTAAWILPA